MKNWDVIVRWSNGTETTGRYVASTRGKALADAWRSDIFEGVTFGEFLRFTSCRRAFDPDWWATPITVEGRPAAYLGHNSQYVQVWLPGRDFVLNAHPYDVLPIERRPLGYRDRLSA